MNKQIEANEGRNDRVQACSPDTFQIGVQLVRFTGDRTREIAGIEHGNPPLRRVKIQTGERCLLPELEIM